MDVNQVRFGNYTIGGGFQTGNKRSESKEEKASKNQVLNQNQNKTQNPDTMLNAMNLAGIQNKAQITLTHNNQVNPTDYLDESRINDIEAMMAEFEAGVSQAATIIENDFPNTFSPQQKLMLAAQAFARE